MSFNYISIILIIALCFTRITEEKMLKSFHGFKMPCSETSFDCLKQALQSVVPIFVEGIPELDIPTLDPLKVDNLVLKLPGHVMLEFKDAHSRGLEKCVVAYVRKSVGNHFEIKFQCNLISKGKYRSKGHLVMFKIDGEGQSTIVCKKLTVICTFRLSSITKEDGQKYMKINHFNTTHAFGGRVIYNMDNLFKGNPEMSQLVLDFMNRNWRMVADEFGRPIVEYGINSILENVNKLLNKVPTKDLMIF